MYIKLQQTYQDKKRVFAIFSLSYSVSSNLVIKWSKDTNMKSAANAYFSYTLFYNMVSESLRLLNHILLSWTSFNHSYLQWIVFSVYILSNTFSIV